MAWATDHWTYHPTSDVDTLSVNWCRKDDTIPGAAKCGGFQHTLDPAKTWAVNKADIEARITAEEGMNA